MLFPKTNKPLGELWSDYNYILWLRLPCSVFLSLGYKFPAVRRLTCLVHHCIPESAYSRHSTGIFYIPNPILCHFCLFKHILQRGFLITPPLCFFNLSMIIVYRILFSVKPTWISHIVHIKPLPLEPPSHLLPFHPLGWHRSLCLSSMRHTANSCLPFYILPCYFSPYISALPPFSPCP